MTNNTDEGQEVKVGMPVYHRKREYFTIPATGDTIHEVNLDYLTYPLIPVKKVHKYDN